MAKANTTTNTSALAGNNTPALATPAAPHTGKYASKAGKLGGAAVVPAFKYAAMALHCNTAPNTAPQKPTSVMGKVYAHVKANPGITGAALVQAMLAMQWQGHPSAYVVGGNVCALWCVGYVVGACSNKHKHLVASPALAPVSK